jgi:hypothetical protein
MSLKTNYPAPTFLVPRAAKVEHHNDCADHGGRHRDPCEDT